MKSKNKAIIYIIIINIIMMNTVYISQAASITGNSRINSRGLVFNSGIASDQIRLIKDFFRARDIPNVPWGYSYDNRTKELVRVYQKNVGLKSDGVVGKSTIDRMNKDITERSYKIGLRVPSTNIKGDMLLINKSSNTLYLLKNGEVKQSYPVATGKSASLTPDGKHKVVVKAKDPAWGGAGISSPIPGGASNNPLGKRWIGISYGGGHKYGVHGNSKPSSIGRYASLGCIRMFNDDVVKLYDQVKMNIPVWIGNEDTLLSYGVQFKSNYQDKKQEDKATGPKLANINIKLNGKDLKLKDPIIIKEGVSYYPFREILERINANISWDGDNKRAIGSLGKNNVEFQLDNNRYKTNGSYLYLPKGQKPFINKDKTYVPIRVALESLGYNVGWEQLTKTVTIDNKQ